MIILLFNFDLPGLCFNSQLDWNYYLSRLDGSIYYEGYKNQQWKKVGQNWTTAERLLLGRSDAYIEMNPADNYKKYPVGVFVGDVYDPNG